jgi:elongation factor Ts
VAITAADVQSLRKRTGAGMLDAKKALEEAGGDAEKAAQILREKGLAGAVKRSDRENTQGACYVSVNDRSASIVELRCETDFVAKSESFVSLVEKIAAAVAERGPEATKEFDSEVDELKITLKENIDLGRVSYLEASEGETLDGYMHVQSGRGTVGVLVKLRGGSKDLAHDIALHVAFARPSYLRREDVPADVVEKERETLTTITRNEGKPEAAIDKIVSGRLDGFFKNICLTEQAFVKDEKLKVQDVLGSAEIVQFALVVVGS